MTEASRDAERAGPEGSEENSVAPAHEEHAEPQEPENNGATSEDPEDVHQRVQGLVLAYAAELRQQTVLVDVELPDRGIRMLCWGLGIVSLILVAVLTVALLQPESEAARASRLRETNLCEQRQATVMHAIGRYTRDHGQPPRDLGALGPAYLVESPEDPASGLPYHYTLQGDIAWLSCPKHLLPPSRPTS